MPEQLEVTQSTEELESSRLASSQSVSFWRSPERVLAVIGAVGLRALDRLDQDWTALVLCTALGADAAKWVASKFKGKAGK